MSIIQKVKEYIQTCPFMDKFSEIHIDWTNANGENYGIENNGDTIIRTFIDGSTKRQYNFVLYAKDCTIEDKNRLENNGFCEDFMFWVEDKNCKGELPKLAETVGSFPESIAAANGMLLYYDDTATTGTYQIQLKLIYIRRAI